MTFYGHPVLAKIASEYPAVDNHAHPLLSTAHKDSFPMEGIISEARGDSLVKDAPYTMACYRAVKELSDLIGCGNDWNTVKQARAAMDYMELCSICFKQSGISCLLLDDGLDTSGLCEDISWHNRFTSSSSRRIVRIETVAEDILRKHIKEHLPATINSASSLHRTFTTGFRGELEKYAQDPSVAGYKSIGCYRTGLNVTAAMEPIEVIVESLSGIMRRYEHSETVRLADKHFNDYIVRITMEIAGEYQKPVQFHTGFGDADLTLSLASPAYLQPLVAAFPSTPVVLLHASYPFTREAGYLASVFANVYVDFGQIFPLISKEGQRNIVKQVLELCPTNKMLWSTDGHHWPEMYYLSVLQAREVLYEVLVECIRNKDLTEEQAIGIVKRALFENANTLYKLGIESPTTTD